MHGLRYIVLVLSLFMLSSIAGAVIDTAKIIGHWSMNDSAADKDILEITGGQKLLANVNTNTISKTGRFGTALNNTDPKGFYAEWDLSTKTGMTGTIDFWYNLQKPLQGYAGLMAYYTASRMELKFDATPQYLSIYTDVLAEVALDNTPAITAQNQWVHVTIVKNATGWVRYENGLFKNYVAGHNEWFPSWGARKITFAGSYNGVDPAYTLTALMDEITISNETWTAADVLVANYTTYPFQYAGDITPPGITFINLNMTYNDTYNTDLAFHVNINEQGVCVNANNTWSSNSTAPGMDFLFSETTLGTGFYFFNVTCNDTTGNKANKIGWFTKDKVSPVITWTSGTNTSFQNIGHVTLNWSCRDDTAIWRVNMNITGSTTGVYHNITGSPMNSSYYSSYFVLNTYNMPNASYIVNSVCCDAHTANSFKRPGITTATDSLRFNMPGAYAEIKDITGLASKTASVCGIDRCSFQFEYSSIPGLKRWLVSSDNHITYLPKSKYPGHFIIGDYWLDFAPLIVDVTDNKDGTYEVASWGDTGKSAVIILNSIGSLNCKAQTDYFTLTAIPVPELKYDPDRLEKTDWFNTESMNLDTVPGVIILLFAFGLYFALLYMAYLSRIAAIQALPMIYGFFLGWLVAVTISVIGGVCFIIVALVLGLSLIAGML